MVVGPVIVLTELRCPQTQLPQGFGVTVVLCQCPAKVYQAYAARLVDQVIDCRERVRCRGDPANGEDQIRVLDPANRPGLRVFDGPVKEAVIHVQGAGRAAWPGLSGFTEPLAVVPYLLNQQGFESIVESGDVRDVGIEIPDGGGEELGKNHELGASGTLLPGNIGPVAAVHGVSQGVGTLDAAVHHRRDHVLIVVDHEAGVVAHLPTAKAPDGFGHVRGISQDDDGVLETRNDAFQEYLSELARW